jgi:hypothetical protein
MPKLSVQQIRERAIEIIQQSIASLESRTKAG